MLTRPVKYGLTGKGCMFMYEDTALQTINAVDEYHGVIGFAEGVCVEGTTFLASDTGTITDTADEGGGMLQCTSVAHGLLDGQFITLNGMGDSVHVGTTQVSIEDDDTFNCDDISWNSDSDTGFWQRGSSITVDEGYGNDYHIMFSASCTSAGNLKNYKFELVKNTTDIDEIVAERKFGTGGDLGNMTAGGMVTMVSGDTIWLKIEGTTDTTNATMIHANLNMFRV